MNFKNVFFKIFSIFLIVLPLIFWQGNYEGPKIFALFIAGIFLAIFWIYRILIKKKYFLLSKTDLLFLTWLLILLISSIFGVHPLESLVGGSYRHQGVIFFLILWLIVKTIQIIPKNDKKLLGRGIAYTVLIQSVILFIQYGTGRIYFGKPLGTIGEANAVAGFLGVGSYFVFKHLDSLLFAFPVIGILITESRSGVLSLLPNLLIIFRNFPRIFKYAFSFAIVLAGIFLILFTSKEAPASPFENRQLIWKLGIEKISKSPILGYGAESGEAVYQWAFKENNTELNGLIVDRAHNLFIDIALWSGLLGLGVFALFLINLFKDLKNKYKRLFLLSLFVYSMFQPLSIVHFILPLLM